jgi:hypothetical protein
MKDPEKIGLSESVTEDLDDMIVATGGSSVLLQILLQFFKEMFEIAKPFTDPKTKKIKAPKGRLPIGKLSPNVRKRIDTMDSAFIETMSYCEWITVFSDGYQRVKQKQEQQSYDCGEKLK